MAKIDNAKMDAVELLKKHNKGALSLELSQKLTEAAKAVKETGKKASVTLKLDIEPAKKMAGAAVMFNALVTSALPKPDAMAAVMFVDDEGTLTRDDPNQRTFAEMERSFKQD